MTGVLLAGVGHIDGRQKKNFLIVDNSRYPTPIALLSSDLSVYKETQVSVIESTFQEFTERKDIAILLINQHVRSPYL